ncbi:MAG: hypothetical protein VYE68_00560, partial [Acidobacteriota bacterium]|nr:hypothetical protein [Acidobacteriota bacterium]
MTMDRGAALGCGAAVLRVVSLLVLVGLVGALTATAQSTASNGGGEVSPNVPLLRWPLPAGAEQYGAIDGRHLHRYV